MVVQLNQGNGCESSSDVVIAMSFAVTTRWTTSTLDYHALCGILSTDVPLGHVPSTGCPDSDRLLATTSDNGSIQTLLAGPL